MVIIVGGRGLRTEGGDCRLRTFSFGAGGCAALHAEVFVEVACGEDQQEPFSCRSRDSATGAVEQRSIERFKLVFPTCRRGWPGRPRRGTGRPDRRCLSERRSHIDILSRTQARVNGVGATLAAPKWGISGVPCFEKLPKPACHLDERINGQPAEQSIKTGPAPWPKIRGMEDEGESDVPAYPQAKRKNNPLPHQRHTLSCQGRR
jgi:hypothetical protein